MMNSPLTGRTPRWQATDLVDTLLSAPARQVVDLWLQSGVFLDENQEPRLLDIESCARDGFSSLVKQATVNCPPSVILTEMLRKGIVDLNDNGTALLKRSAYAAVNADASRLRAPTPLSEQFSSGKRFG